MMKALDRLVFRLTLGILAGAMHPFMVCAQTIPASRAMPPTTLPTLGLPNFAPPPPMAIQTINPSIRQPVVQGYKLGAGDIVRLDLFDVPELTLEPRYNILFDGTVNLPWVGRLSLQGMTIDQASELVRSRYQKFVKTPVVTVSLVAPRPLKIGVLGAVNRPGSYIVNVIGSEMSQSSLSQRSASESGNQWPTVSKAIQTAGGIAQQANIRLIEIRRPQLDGSQEILKVDLWKYLQAGELAQDVVLQDGDTIFIPDGATVDPVITTMISKSNFSPEQVQVHVVGEVVKPGAIAVRPNSTMMQAILAAGGIAPGRGNKTKVELIRLMPDGTTNRREFKFDLSKGLDDAANPSIYQNDVIVVNRNGTAKLSDLLGAVVSPVSGAFGLLRLLLGN